MIRSVESHVQTVMDQLIGDHDLGATIHGGGMKEFRVAVYPELVFEGILRRQGGCEQKCCQERYVFWERDELLVIGIITEIQMENGGFRSFLI